MLRWTAAMRKKRSFADDLSKHRTRPLDPLRKLPRSGSVGHSAEVGMVGIELRQATPADAAAIRSLTRAAYAKWVALIGREHQPMTADYEVTLRQHRFDLLLSGGVPAALIETVEEDGQLLTRTSPSRRAFSAKGSAECCLRMPSVLLGISAKCVFVSTRINASPKISGSMNG